ncbi:HTH_Tnp_Tc3_2 domain-containing protein [Trichonephila clavipes]|nr:HTH_Tnp_Tc3_2 domain-containing protein [Trichonephila clavipes]
MAQREHLDDFLRGRIIGRLECASTQLEVSEKIGIAKSVISRLWQRFQDDGNKQTEHSIRPVSSATGTTVSRQTVYRRLGHIGRRPVRCVPPTATHCRLRLTWSREHALCTPQQWSCVMFSDESGRFQSNSHRILYNILLPDLPVRELFLTFLIGLMNDDRPHLSGCHSGKTCTFVSGRHWG